MPVTVPWAPLGPATETELWLHLQTGQAEAGRTPALCFLPPGGPVPRAGRTPQPWGWGWGCWAWRLSPHA